MTKLMKKTGLAVAAVALLAGCTAASESAAPKASGEYATLTKYMVDNYMDMNNVMDRKTWIPHAGILAENISDYYVVDIRQGDVMPKNGIEDWKDGHIPGAHHSSFETILKDVRAGKAGDNILVVSTDGQAAAAAATALRLSGYPNTKVLKFGMAGWNNKFNNWSEKQSNFAVGNKNWVAGPVKTAPKKFNTTPTLKTGKTNGADILAARVDEFLAKGFQGMNPQEVVNNPEKYFIVNQGSGKAYGQYGHIKGAEQFSWPTIRGTKKHPAVAGLYPTSGETIVQYCWTGHAAITVSSWMNIIGYNAHGVEYGTNAMIIKEMKKKKFKKPMNLPYVTGEK